MRRMRFVRASLVLLFACAHAQPARAPAAIELVETAPSETTLDHPDILDAWQVWPEMIASARERLELNEFYLSNSPGSRLEPVVQAVLDAVRRGVQVRLLCEEKFYKTYPETIDRLGAGGVLVRRFDAKKLFDGGVLHAKYFVVDGREAFLGSQNFDWRSLEHIQELGVRSTAPHVVEGLRAIFEMDWALAGGAELPTRRIDQPPSLILAASPKGHLPDGVPWDLQLLMERIGAAKTSVRVQLLTYKSAPDFRELEDALVAAAARGVRVQLLISNWVLRPWTLEPLRKLDPRVEVRILTIPEASSGHIPFARVAHAKYMVVDGVHAWIGTSNWERDYFYFSRNVGVFTDEPRLERFFEDVWSSRYAQTFDRAVAYPAPRTD